MRVCRKHPDVLGIEGAPLLQPAPITVLHERSEVASIVGVGMRGEPALGIHVTPEARHPFERRRFQWLSESAISSPIRARNSVLMPGWKRSRSVLPMASRPTETFSPSGTSAIEPISFASEPNKYSRCESRACPQRGLPLANKVSKDFRFGSSARM